MGETITGIKLVKPKAEGTNKRQTILIEKQYINQVQTLAKS
jgi:hypothetical protein